MKRAFLLIVFMLAASPAAAAPDPASTTMVSGRILDTQGGLPVPNASVDLMHDGTVVATGHSDTSGRFRISNVPAGSYVVLVRSNGYETTRLSPDLLVSTDVGEVSFQM